MTRGLSSSDTQNTEEERAFLQTRVALFWKASCFLVSIGGALGAVGAVVNEPGPDFLLTLASAGQAGLFWWLCQRGVRSVRFLRSMETGGLLLNSAIGALTGRYVFVGFALDHAISAEPGKMLADGYVSLMQLSGMAMIVAIRAALIPSRPRRTLAITALFGVPMILVNSFLVPEVSGFSVRATDSGAFPWMPTNMIVMWGFATITSVIISWIIYGLRAEVRHARRLGQYVLEQKLGEGGMGEVYRARHGLMRRDSAIKLLRKERADETDLLRFEREVQLTARLTHPNTITIFDYGRTHDGVFYYAMELLDGATLQRIVSVDGAQPPGRVVRILDMVCGALSEAHAIGLIHRDIKPANIMLCTQGGECDVVKLLDFGLVKEFQAHTDVELTAASAIVGTPQYMAPESIRTPDAADARTDIYALGAVAYYLLTGVEVFDGKSMVEVCAQHLHEAPKPFATRGISVPAALEALVLSCLNKQPEDRPQTARDLRRRLHACNVTPWDDETARTWWAEHQTELEAHTVQTTALARTIAIDGASRA